MTHFILAVFSLLAAAEPAPTPSAAPAARKPPALKFRLDTDRLSYRLTVRPGVPDPGTTVEIELELAEVLKEPDPNYGTRKPLPDAELRGILVGGKKKWAEAHRAVALRDEGTYGFTFTAPEAGVYGFHLRGKTGDPGDAAYSVAIPFGVWPIAEGTSPPAMPAKEPSLERGDMAHGRALCAERCKKDLPGALPAGTTPQFLPSDFAAQYGDDELLTQVLGEGAELSPVERNDLLYFLRSLHFAVSDFFPQARAVLAHEFTINEHGQKRLAEALKLKEEPAATTAMVFVAFKSDAESLSRVDYSNRVARDKLKPENKLGYIMFLDLPGEGKVRELAVVLGREPHYPILDLRARDANGKPDAALNPTLHKFVGSGRFDDAKSLHGGPAALASKLLPIYLRAAELATMYYGDEREFKQFDSEFSGGSEPSAEPGQLKVKLKRGQ